MAVDGYASRYGWPLAEIEAMPVTKAFSLADAAAEQARQMELDARQRAGAQS